MFAPRAVWVAENPAGHENRKGFLSDRIKRIPEHMPPDRSLSPPCNVQTSPLLFAGSGQFPCSPFEAERSDCAPARSEGDFTGLIRAMSKRRPVSRTLAFLVTYAATDDRCSFVGRCISVAQLREHDRPPLHDPSL